MATPIFSIFSIGNEPKCGFVGCPAKGIQCNLEPDTIELPSELLGVVEIDDILLFAKEIDSILDSTVFPILPYAILILPLLPMYYYNSLRRSRLNECIMRSNELITHKNVYWSLESNFSFGRAWDKNACQHPLISLYRAHSVSASELPMTKMGQW